jgi:hypothetical protein
MVLLASNCKPMLNSGWHEQPQTQALLASSLLVYCYSATSTSWNAVEQTYINSSSTSDTVARAGECYDAVFYLVEPYNRW